MANTNQRYECKRYKSLKFYVEGKALQFIEGFFTATNQKQTKVLDKLADAKKVNESPKKQVDPPKKPNGEEDNGGEDTGIDDTGGDAE